MGVIPEFTDGLNNKNYAFYLKKKTDLYWN